jgi:hypothetical protein
MNENEQVWTTKDGRKVMIKDMDDAHLRNTIFYLNKRYGAYWDGPMPGPCDGDPNVEVAPAALDPGVLLGGPHVYWPIYDALRREAQRRQLAWI